MTPRSWSAASIWDELLIETEGQPFTREVYADWLMGEHLHPWGKWPRLSPMRTRELVP